MSEEIKVFLGIYHGHNATVSVLSEDGEFIASLSEERFRNEKNYSGFPTLVTDFILNKYPAENILGVGLPFKYMNSVFLSQTPESNLIFVMRNKLLAILRGILLRLNRRLHDKIYEAYKDHYAQKVALKQKLITAKALGIEVSKVRNFHHQLAHAYSAYYLSPFNQEDALVLTLDGEGDGLCATVSTMKNGKLKTISVTPQGCSLGWIYMDVTRYLGMKPNEHEFKVMGLAPFAKREHIDEVYEVIKSWIVVDDLTFKTKFDTHLSYDVMCKELATFRFDNIAGAFQLLVEERLKEWVGNAIKTSGLDTIVCAGGVFMNVKANLAVSELPSVKKMWIMPSSGDESSPMGSAIASYLRYCRTNELQPVVRSLKDLYLGMSVTNEEISAYLLEGDYDDRYEIEYVKDIEEVIARLLSEGEIVANLSGRMEWGARALGNRSILADPSKPELIKIINEYVKNRDFWMPFAGSILEERANDYFANPKGISADYMVMSFRSTPLAQKELISALHSYDLTIRPQVVRKEWNPRYWNIIKNFERKTGIGGVLNTSFNLHGYPIVATHRAALDVFEQSGIKYLVLENYLIHKA